MFGALKQRLKKIDENDTYQPDTKIEEQITKNIQRRKAKLMEDANWDDLLFWDKIRLIDIWSIISILANITQIIGCLYSIFRNRLNIMTADKSLGIGCMFAWFIILRYILKT